MPRVYVPVEPTPADLPELPAAMATICVPPDIGP